MPVYITLLRTDRTRTNDALKGLEKLPKNYKPNLTIYYVASVFGEWDNCIWFEASNHDHAIDFVQKKIATIPGVINTYTLPTTPMKNYVEYSK